MSTLRNFVCLSLLALAAACGGGDDKPPAGVITLNQMFKADFDLIDQNGEPATDERFEGKPMFIYYGFTSCPNVCPAALGRMTAALDLMGSKANRIQPLFITVDPKRDTPERLANHLAYDPRILGLTGSPEALEEARSAMQVFAKEVPLPDSALVYTVDHQSLFFVTDREGTPLYALNDTADPAAIARVLEQQL